MSRLQAIQLIKMTRLKKKQVNESERLSDGPQQITHFGSISGINSYDDDASDLESPDEGRTDSLLHALSPE
jgi:hypothetical protein